MYFNGHFQRDRTVTVKFAVRQNRQIGRTNKLIPMLKVGA